MELIKKIKEAEVKAQQTIENAKADAATQAEKERENRQLTLKKAQQERIKIIESATTEAQQQALDEIKILKEKAEKNRQQLRNKAQSKMAHAVTKVMDYLGSHSAKESQNDNHLRG
jgi:vacuolar-type H+-ATPase subunit H